MDIELITTEHGIGPFALDIYAREVNTGHFDELSQFKHEISSGLGDLSWERLDDKRACRIAAYIDVSNEDSMVEWGIKTLVSFKDTFTKYL